MNATTTNSTTGTASNDTEKASFADKAHVQLDKSKEAVVDAAARSKEAITETAKSTTAAVKQNPGTTAAIVAGAAAAIAGAAFGASKLLEKKNADTKTKASDGSNAKSTGSKSTGSSKSTSK